MLHFLRLLFPRGIQLPPQPWCVTPHSCTLALMVLNILLNSNCTAWTSVPADGISAVVYLPAANTIFVGDRVSMRLLNATNGRNVSHISVGDPTPCISFDNTSVTLAYGPLADTTHWPCLALDPGACASNPTCRPITDGCVPNPFWSTCQGNLFYFALPMNNGASVVTCSSLGQCERRSATTLSLESTIAPGDEGFPRGFYCGNQALPGEMVAQQHRLEMQQRCPVMRYTSPYLGATMDGTISSFFDTAAGVISDDPSAPGTPDVLYLMSSRELERDNGVLSRPALNTNREAAVSKRSLDSFNLTCSPIGSPAGFSCYGGYSQYSSRPQDFITQTTTAQNVTAMHLLGHMNRYIGGFSAGDHMYFVLQECDDSVNDLCETTHAKIARFCKSSYAGAGNPFNAFNRYIKVGLGCGGRRHIIATVFLPQPPESLSSRLGGGGVLLVLAADRSSTTGVASNHALCVLKHTSAVGGAAPDTTLNAAFAAAVSPANADACTTAHAPVADAVLRVGRSTDALVYAEDARASGGNAQHYTSMQVDTVNGYVSVYIGTANGTVLRLTLNGPPPLGAAAGAWTSADGSLEVFRDVITRVTTETLVPVSTLAPAPSAPGVGVPVTHLTVNTRSNTLVAASYGGLTAVPLAACDTATSCAACTALATTLCGWCVLLAQCTERRACPDATPPAAGHAPNATVRADTAWTDQWVGPSTSASSECPAIVPGSTNYTTPVGVVRAPPTVAVSGLPGIVAAAHTYFCVWSWPLGEVVAPAALVASGTSLACDPVTFARLPERPLVHVSALSVVYGPVVADPLGVGALQLPVVVARDALVDVYDCETQTTCDTCTTAGYACAWCPFTATCQASTVASACPRAVGVAGACPRVSSVSPVRLHSLATTAATPTLSFTAAHLPETITGVAYGCVFTLGPAHAGGGGVYTSVATYVSASSVTCVLPTDIPGRSTADAADFDTDGVLSYTVGLAVNGSAITSLPEGGIPFELFSCAAMAQRLGAQDCGRCMAATGVPYDCGWCDSGATCVASAACVGSPLTTTLEDCPAPVLTGVSPLRAPRFGGTNVTITGSNLGRSTADVTSVDVGGISAAIVAFDAAAGTLTVRTGVSATVRTGPVVISFANPNIAAVTSTQTFAYVVPSLSSVTPRIAPTSGGTVVTFRGEELGSTVGNRRTVHADGRACTELTALSATTFSCVVGTVTPAAPVSAHVGVWCVQIDGMVGVGVCARDTSGADVPFAVVPDPTVTAHTPTHIIAAGGTNMTVTGTHLNAALAPTVTVAVDGRRPTVGVTAGADGRSAVFAAPALTVAIGDNATTAATVTYAFDSARIVTTLPYIANPAIVEVTPLTGSVGATVQIRGTNLQRGGTPVVTFGGAAASPIAELSSDTNLVVRVPERAAEDENGNDDENVTVRLQLGAWNATSTQPFMYASTGAVGAAESEGAPVAVAAPVVAVLVVALLLAVIIVRRQRRQRAKYESEMVGRIHKLEFQIVDVCKQGFSELQSDRTLSFRSIDQWAKPRPFQDFMHKVCFTSPETHPAPIRRTPAGFSDVVEKFALLLRTKALVGSLCRAVEKTPGRTIKDKFHVAALLQMCVGQDSAYGFEVLCVLMDQLLSSKETRRNPKLVLRRTDTIAEKYVSCWLAREMYPHVVQHVGKPLCTLLQALKVQSDKGPVDALSGAAMYTLNGNSLLKESVQFERRTLSVAFRIPEVTLADGAATVRVDVNSTDTPTQVLHKAFDVAAHTGAEMPADVAVLVPRVALVDAGWPASGGRVLRDVDDTCELDATGGSTRVRLNTLAHLGVLSDSTWHVAYVDTTGVDAAAIASPRRSSLSKEERHKVTKRRSRVQAFEDLEKVHLQRAGGNAPTGSGGGGGGGEGVLPGEVFLTYMLTCKGIVQPYIDTLMQTLFGATDTEVPPPIKRLYDYLDDRAAVMGIKDAGVRHVWKSNAVPLRFWVNLIKNPEFLYDIRKDDALNSNLSTVAQVVMDACSTSQQQLGKHSPVNKLLYRGEVLKYREMVAAHYEQIGSAPRDTSAPNNDRPTSFTSTENSAALLLLGYAALSRHDIVARLERQGLESLAQDFLKVCTQYEVATKALFDLSSGTSVEANEAKGYCIGVCVHISSDASPRALTGILCVLPMDVLHSNRLWSSATGVVSLSRHLLHTAHPLQSFPFASNSYLCSFPWALQAKHSKYGCHQIVTDNAF
eukprot:m.1216799 g.1216799  ORF g.1216799 m.1216799 type:complete len:2198 (+) comp24615_c0_seq1:290-6883(+)